MSKQPLAIVCALAFVVGGASAFVLEYQPGGTAIVQGVADLGADDGRGASAEAEAAESQPDELVRPEEVSTSDDGHDFAPRPKDASVESAQTTGEAARAGKAFVGVKGRRSADVRGGEGRRATRAYTRVPSRGAASGGQGIAAYTVGGVKKTGGGVKKAGAAIGKTFGKIGGVFHE